MWRANTVVVPMVEGEGEEDDQEEARGGPDLATITHIIMCTMCTMLCTSYGTVYGTPRDLLNRIFGG